MDSLDQILTPTSTQSVQSVGAVSLDHLIALPRAERIDYVQRIRVPHAKYGELMKECEVVHGLSRKVRRPGCLVIYGESGCGKTTLCQEFEAARPTARLSLDKDIVPVLNVVMPPKPTLKAVAGQILMKLGDPGWKSGTFDQMAERIIKLMNELAVEIVFLDEAQNLVDMTGAVTEYGVTTFLMQLTDAVNIPFIAMGIDRCCEMFSGNEMLRRRFNTQLEFAQYDFNRADDRTEWIKALTAFADKLPVRNLPDFGNPRLARKMWYASLGLVGHMAAIFAKAVDLAICDSETQDSLTIDQLSRAFRKIQWPQVAELLDPFDRGVDVESESLPRITKEYAGRISDYTSRKQRQRQKVLTDALKKQRNP
jgi:hypothetical protein